MLPLRAVPVTQLPKTPGVYVLLLQVPQFYPQVQFGRFGCLDVAAGNYLYVGSARGPGGIAARVGRHLRSEKKPHWHIDYFPQRASAVWVTETLAECACIDWLLARLPSAQRAWENFGASDCRCGGHLLYSADALRHLLPGE